MAELSPMMQQYMDIKEQHKDHILLFRLGDFYEMFFDDAVLVSRELELTLTGRNCGLEERAPMCGVPFHSYETYVARLIKKGYKIAICDQMEDPAVANGLVKRDVTRVITPGTVLETNMLDEGCNNYICSICLEDGQYGLAFCDVSTGEIHGTQLRQDADNSLKNELAKFSPAEVIFNPDFLDKTELSTFLRDKLNCSVDLLPEDCYEENKCCKALQTQFDKSITELGLSSKVLLVKALGALLHYLSLTQKHGLDSIKTLQLYEDSQYMTLDLIARRNLELTQTLRSGEKKGTLLWVLDKTKTAMGKRRMRSTIEKPLIDATAINKRLNAVAELVGNSILLSDVRDCLSGIFDLERLITRIVYGNVTPRELKSLQFTAEKLPQLKNLLKDCSAAYLKEIYEEMDGLEDLCELIDRAIVEDPPALLRDGGMICQGYNSKLDEYNIIVHDTKAVLARIEAEEKEKTGIKNLKIGFNNVFGYYLEVSKSNIPLVPDHYIRKQTLTNSERYITQELKELEQTILSAKENISKLETALYDEVRMLIAREIDRVQSTATAVSKLDVYASFAEVSVKNNYCHPNVDLSNTIDIREGRHPVVECMMGDRMFVSNDTHLDNGENQIAIITGPNMAGKSTYMRQTALIVLMAQIGCFVPAKSATIGIVDGIYTRVGASDDLSSGQSTFMVEMSEVAHILKNATSKSLLILDEIGRGTSTFDGMSIARAILEFIANKRKLGAKTLFATHYHELTELEDLFPNMKNYNIAVKKKGSDIIFLRRIVRGGTDDSYGIYVSKLAGISNEIIKRAEEILAELESSNPVAANIKENKKQRQETEDNQLMLVQSDDSEIVRRLREVDLNTMSPIQAMILLSELKELI